MLVGRPGTWPGLVSLSLHPLPHTPRRRLRGRARDIRITSRASDVGPVDPCWTWWSCDPGGESKGNRALHSLVEDSQVVRHFFLVRP